MSLEKIVDARLDPRTVTMNDVVLTEKYTVTKIDDLVDAYGFSLSETPVKKSGAQATISSVTYVDGNGVRVSLTEQSIGSINLLPNQFMCNYGTTLAQPEINRNYRIGQIFVNGVLEGEELTVVYRALGSNSSSDVFNRLVDDKLKEKLPTNGDYINAVYPIGSCFTQYEIFNTNGSLVYRSPEPSVLYSNTVWNKNVGNIPVSNNFRESFIWVWVRTA